MKQVSLERFASLLKEAGYTSKPVDDYLLVDLGAKDEGGFVLGVFLHDDLFQIQYCGSDFGLTGEQALEFANEMNRKVFMPTVDVDECGAIEFKTTLYVGLHYSYPQMLKFFRLTVWLSRQLFGELYRFVEARNVGSDAVAAD